VTSNVTVPTLGKMTTSNGSGFRHVWSANRVEFAMLGALLLLAVVLSALQPRFLTFGNLENVLSQVTVLGIIAIGQTLVILTGGIDLSVGGIAALSSVAGGLVLLEYGTIPGVIAMLLAGLLVGLVNGVLVSYVGLAPFIVTLGTLSVTSSLAYVLADGRSITGLPGGFAWLGNGSFAGVKLYVFLFIGLYVLAHLVPHAQPTGALHLRDRLKPRGCSSLRCASTSLSSRSLRRHRAAVRNRHQHRRVPPRLHRPQHRDRL